MAKGVQDGNQIRARDVVPALMSIDLSVFDSFTPPASVSVDDGSLVSAAGATVTVYRPEQQTVEVRNMATDWADADAVRSVVIRDGYLYALLVDTGTNPDTYRVYRFTLGSMSSTGTLVTFAGATVLAATNDSMQMACDGTHFFFNFQAGNSANDYAVAKYTFSGTTFTYASSVNMGTTASRVQEIAARENGDFLAFSTTGQVLYRYNASGTLQATGTMALKASGADEELYYLNDFATFVNMLGDAAAGTRLHIYGRVFIQ